MRNIVFATFAWKVQMSKSIIVLALIATGGLAILLIWRTAELRSDGQAQEPSAQETYSIATERPSLPSGLDLESGPQTAARITDDERRVVSEAEQARRGDRGSDHVRTVEESEKPDRSTPQMGAGRRERTRTVSGEGSGAAERRRSEQAQRSAATAERPLPQAASGGPLRQSVRADIWQAAGREVQVNDDGVIVIDPGNGLVVEADRTTAYRESPITQDAPSQETTGGMWHEPAREDDLWQGSDQATAQIDPPVDVIQIARRWDDDVLQVSYAVVTGMGGDQVLPNGLIVSQVIPEGWEVVEAEPPIEAVDTRNRVVKWMLVGDAVAPQSIYSVSMRAESDEQGDWNEARAWYTYRQPDGQGVEVAVMPYGASDIQPGN